ncbi:hypothetical protein J437_LFUL003793 [Ladona fulva]|uniref:Uncharacterized protein n=1 Tax=Ladona fulva TaxID=123851 RepID=A0A8K0JYF7_LADFU|nr:hypothetical protein J437_LFUL003793 [Ladona fulva]
MLERQFLNTPLEDDPGAPPGDGENEEEAMKEIGTPPSPSPPSLSRTPTTESRTDCELTTSQVDSSGLEELPLRRGARGEAAKGPGPLATSIKRKIRNQAGRLRTKMRSIPRPTFRVPEGLTRPAILHRSKAPPPPSSVSVADSGSSAADTLERPTRPEKKRTAAQLFDFRTYPRIFERKAKAKELSKRTSSSHDEDLSGSSRAEEAPPRRKGPLGMRWAHRFADIRYADDEEAVSGGKENGSTSSLRGSAPEGSWSESGGQQDGGGASPERRPGVLEEIDADEFFLREKGLSRDDVRRGEEISSEIRDAFRPTAASEGDEPADEEYVEEEVVEVEMTPPLRPTRKTIPEWKQRQVVIDEGFMTFPPQRPKRRKGMIVRSAEVADGDAATEDDEAPREVEERWRKGAIVEGAIMAEHLVDDGGEWEEGWGRKEEEDEKMEDKSWFIEGRPREWTESEGDRSAEDGEREREMEDMRVEEGEVREEAAELEVETGGTTEEAIPPLPPKRRRRGGFEASATSLDDSRCISSEEVRLEEVRTTCIGFSIALVRQIQCHVNHT